MKTWQVTVEVRTHDPIATAQEVQNTIDDALADYADRVNEDPEMAPVMANAYIGNAKAVEI